MTKNRQPADSGPQRRGKPASAVSGDSAGSRAPGASVAGRTRWRALLCPIDPTHGPLLDWPTDRWGFFCSHQAHGGNGAFFTTAEAEGAVPADPAPPNGSNQPSSTDLRVTTGGAQLQLPLAGAI